MQITVITFLPKSCNKISPRNNERISCCIYRVEDHSRNLKLKHLWYASIFVEMEVSSSTRLGPIARAAGPHTRVKDTFVLHARLCGFDDDYVTSSHGNQCSWPPTRSHGAKPTRPASFGRLCERAFYLFLLSPFRPFDHPSPFHPPTIALVSSLLFSPFSLSLSLSLFSPCSLSLLLLRSFSPPLHTFPRCFAKITHAGATFLRGALAV